MSNKVLVNICSVESKERFEILMDKFLSTFKIPIPLNEIFLYNIFVSDDSYVLFEWEDKDYGFEIPSVLLDNSMSFDAKLAFIQKAKIDAVTNGKPQWMIYVEENATCNGFDIEPSTFLFIHPVKDEYKDLAEALSLFLLSTDYIVYNV